MRIDLELRAQTQTIWLNAKDITVTRVDVLIDGGVHVRAHWRYVGDELLALELQTEVGPSKQAAVVNGYRARLSDTAVLGPYRRKVEGNWYAYTTFTPIEARRAFPCFDEPRFKTPWELMMRIPERMSAFSNAPMTGDRRDRMGIRTIRFAPTEPLPSEVFAFAVGPFDVYKGSKVRVITPKGHAAEGRAADEAAAQVMPRLEDYVGYEYPFHKLDFLALPQNAYGAVENPGLITFLSTRLLVDPKDAAKTLELRKLEAHEIGHQWFGDVVTQKDWPDVWLSEGFATWIANKITDEERAPERRMLEFITQRERAMQSDVATPGRPVRMTIGSRAQASDVYNRLVYQKGAAILAMLEGWLGDENWRRALQSYLKKHQFGSASTSDLAESVRMETGTDVGAVMDSFLDAAGVPKIRARLLCDSKARLRIEQAGSRATPVCFKTTGLARCVVIQGAAGVVDLASCPSWVYLNAKGTGYYRTEWGAAELSAIRPALNELTLAEKLTLVYDLQAQKTRGAEARTILARLAEEGDPAVGMPAAAALKALN